MSTAQHGGLAALRSVTDEIHRAAEDQLALPHSLSSVDDVGGLLIRWIDVAHQLEPLAGGHVPTSVLPALFADLHTLGLPQQDPDPAATSPSGGASLGAAWVLLGARLGLRSLAAHVDDLVGVQLATFRSIDASALTAVRRHIDELAADELEAEIEAAREAFAVAQRTLHGPPWTTARPRHADSASVRTTIAS